MTFENASPDVLAEHKAAKHEKRVQRPVKDVSCSLTGLKAKKRPKLIVAGVPKSTRSVKMPGALETTTKQELLVSSELADDGTPLGGVIGEPVVKKKKTLQQKKNRKEPKAGISVKGCSEYLNTWKTDRQNWRFIKVRQTWLLQHMYDDNKVNILDPKPFI